MSLGEKERKKKRKEKTEKRESIERGDGEEEEGVRKR
jgi:hypothetical protein